MAHGISEQCATIPDPSGLESGPWVDVTSPCQILQWLATAGGEFQFISPEWTNFTGQDIAHGLGAGWLTMVHPDDRQALMAEFALASVEGRCWRRHFRLRRKDGSDASMLMEGLPRPGGFIGMCVPAACGESEAARMVHRLSDLLECTRLAGVALDVEGRVRYANGSLSKLLGCPAAEIIGRHFFDAFTPPGSLSPSFPLHVDGEDVVDFPLEFETEILDTTNDRHLMLWHTIILRTSSGVVSCVVLIGDDITSKRQAEQRVLLTHKVFETTEMAIVITDATASIIAANSSFTRLTGYSVAEAIGQNPRILQSKRHDLAFYERMWNSILQTGHWHGEIWDRRKDGSQYPKFLSISTIKDEHGQVTNHHGIFYDISERKTIEDKLDHMAHYDALTDLPNRTLLHERLDVAVTAAARTGTKVALLYLDLDHFKEVNDTVGHAVGDLLLQEVGIRLRACVRSVDTVARLGGDEFVVLLVDLKSDAVITKVANKLLNAIAAPFTLNGQQFKVSTSIGISLCPDDHYLLDHLLKNADQAMYRAKAKGRAGFMYFNELGAA